MAAENSRKAEINWSSISFADDTTMSFSIDLNDSVFDTSNTFDPRSTSLEGNDSMSEDANLSVDDGKISMEADTPLSQAYNVGDKRFERMLDAGCIRNDVITLKPVSCE